MKQHRYNGKLPYLAGPHADRHHNAELGASLQFGAEQQIKLALIGYRRRVSSPNPLVVSDAAGLSLEFTYQLYDRH